MQCSQPQMLSETEKAKLDPPLIRLLTNGDNVGEFDSSKRSDGSTTYTVVIIASQEDEVRATGATISSIFGSVIVAHATIEELRKILLLKYVRAIQTGSQKIIQRKKPKELQ